VLSEGIILLGSIARTGARAGCADYRTSVTVKRPHSNRQHPGQKTTEKTSQDAKPTRRGVRAAFASKLQGTLDKLVSGKQQKGRVGAKSRPHERIHKRAGRKVTLEYGSVVKDRSVYDCAVGEWFCHDIEMSLPYIETIMLYDLLVRGYIYG